MTEETREVTIQIPPGKHARVMWTLVDRYTLRRYDGTQLGMWEVASKTVTDEQDFSPPIIPSPPPKDTTAPMVTSVSPASDRRGVVPTTDVTATFSEKMNATTITESTFQLFRLDPNRDPSQINNVTIDLSSDGLTAILNPSTRLEANKKYRASITTGATDAAGNPLATIKAWTFTTGKG